MPPPDETDPFGEAASTRHSWALLSSNREPQPNPRRISSHRLNQGRDALTDCLVVRCAGAPLECWYLLARPRAAGSVLADFSSRPLRIPRRPPRSTGRPAQAGQRGPTLMPQPLRAPASPRLPTRPRMRWCPRQSTRHSRRPSTEVVTTTRLQRTPGPTTQLRRTEPRPASSSRNAVSG